MPPNHHSIGESMYYLAGVLESLNKLEESEKLYRETYEFRKKHLMQNHPDIGTSMNNLAGVLLNLN